MVIYMFLNLKYDSEPEVVSGTGGCALCVLQVCPTPLTLLYIQ